VTIFATATFGGSNGTELAVADAAFAKAIACDNAVLHNGRVIAAEAYAALAGWRPAPDLGWLRPEHPPRPAFTQSHGYFPLAFCTRFTVSPP